MNNSKIVNYQDRIRNQWNKVYDRFNGQRLSVWREQATHFIANKIEYLKYNSKLCLLDAGCGDGRNLELFAKAGFKVTGVDISDSAIKKCKKLCKDYPNIRFKQLLLEDLDLHFKPASFDVIVCDFVLVHIEYIEKVIHNFHLLLKKGGISLLEFASPKDPHCGRGVEIKERQYIQNDVFLRYYTMDDIHNILKKYFLIINIDSQYYTDPYHGLGYHRKKRHTHHSYYVMAKKL